MSISLHTATVGTFLQVAPAIAGIVDKAEAHCRAEDLPDDALTTACLAPDMWNFAKQVTLVAVHSQGAITAVREGVMRPDMTPPPTDFASLRQCLTGAIAFLKTVEPAEIDGLIGRDMRFEFGERRMDFTVEDFLLTFSLPNFHFHAAAAYNILRSQGLPVGKMDYLGALRLKG